MEKIRPCQICYSPYRKEMEKMVLKNGSSMMAVARKYAKVMGKKESTVYQAVQRHFGKKHYDKLRMIGPGVTSAKIEAHFEEDYERAVTFEEAGQTLLQQGMKQVDELSAKEKLNMATKMQKVNLEGKRQQLEENQLKLQVAKLFGGFLGQQPIKGHLEASEVEENND